MLDAPRSPFRVASDPAVEDAIGWMVNLNSGEATSREHAEFRRWYELHPANRAAWDRLSGSLGPLRVAADLSSPKGTLTRRIAQREMSRRRFIKTAAAGAATTGALVLVNRVYPLRDFLADHFTWTGQRETIALNGGGSLTLAPKTAVNVRHGEDKDCIELLSGEVFVKSVEGRSRPLDLVMRDWVLRPTSGRVALHNRDEMFSATTLDQPLDVDIANDTTKRLEAGQTLALEDGALSQYPADVTSEAAWADGLLIAKDRPLADVVTSIRPYFVGVIRVSSAAARIRVGGVFRLGEPRKTLTALAETLPLSVREVTPFWLSIDLV